MSRRVISLTTYQMVCAPYLRSGDGQGTVDSSCRILGRSVPGVGFPTNVSVQITVWETQPSRDGLEKRVHSDWLNLTCIMTYISSFLAPVVTLVVTLVGARRCRRRGRLYSYNCSCDYEYPRWRGCGSWILDLGPNKRRSLVLGAFEKIFLLLTTITTIITTTTTATPTTTKGKAHQSTHLQPPTPLTSLTSNLSNL